MPSRFWSFSQNTDVSDTSRAVSMYVAEQNNQTDAASRAAAVPGQKEQNVNVSSGDQRVCQQMQDPPGCAVSPKMLVACMQLVITD